MQTGSMVILILSTWLGIAIIAGATGSTAALNPPAPQFAAAILTLSVIALSRIPRIRAWIDALDVRAMVALHLTRFVGIVFLVLAARGTLPPAFGVPAGWGDIAVALTALLLIAAVHPRKPGGRGPYFVWSAVGLIDLLYVVYTAARIGTDDPASLQVMMRLPLSLLPTFLVPLLLGTHVLIIRRLVAPNPEP